MRGLRQILAILIGFFGLLALAGGVALTNAVGDFAFVDEELRRFLSLFVDVPEAMAVADRGAAILFLSGVVFIGVAWLAWPRGR